MADYVHPRVTDVFLEYNGSDHYEPYFCSRCRQMIGKHKGEIIREEPSNYPHKTPFLTQCRNCKRNYNFVAFVKYIEDETVIKTEIRVDYLFK